MRTRLALALLAALALAAGVAACGGGSGAAQPSPEQGFLRSMVPHHTSAVQMAELAATEARTPFVRTLAAEIRASQEREIAQMRQIHQRLFGTALEPDMGGHMALGLSAEQAGMDHMDGEMMIRGKRPFDRAFVDEMVPTTGVPPAWPRRYWPGRGTPSYERSLRRSSRHRSGRSAR